MGNVFFDYLLCGTLICLFVYGWGKCKRAVAVAKRNKADALLAGHDYLEAIRLYQEVGDELRNEPHYWYNLAVALTGAGSRVDAAAALEKLFLLDPGHRNGALLAQRLRGDD